MKSRIAMTCIFAFASLSVQADNLVIPSFAHNVAGLDGHSWSTEVYLANPTHMPIQVSLVSLLPGYVVRPSPCDLFMPPTRVIPPRSAVVWTAAGLAVDLGCADEALGALVLNADGPVKVSSRMVSHDEGEPASTSGLLVGRGQEVRAIPVDELPPAGNYLLPTLTWRCNSCKTPAFDTYLGFANPSAEPVTVHLELPAGRAEGSLKTADTHQALPTSIEIAPGSWLQTRVSMTAGPERTCAGPETFDLLISTDHPLAFYASVVDRSSHDARIVEPVALQ